MFIRVNKFEENKSAKKIKNKFEKIKARKK